MTRHAPCMAVFYALYILISFLNYYNAEQLFHFHILQFYNFPCKKYFTYLKKEDMEWTEMLQNGNILSD